MQVYKALRNGVQPVAVKVLGSVSGGDVLLHAFARAIGHLAPTLPFRAPPRRLLTCARP